MKTRIYHNPRCSKSRQTLTLLEDRGMDTEIIEYLNAPPTVEDLDRICKLLGVEPVEIIRTREERFKDLGLSAGDTRSREDWLAIMSENPILMERPIVLHGKKAAVGRPPENVLAILD